MMVVFLKAFILSEDTKEDVLVKSSLMG